MLNSNEIALLIKNQNALAVIKTDTLYGLIGSANSMQAVSKIYAIKNRNKNKPLIVLVANYNQLKEFNIKETYLNKTKSYWPGPYSLILPVGDSQYIYLAKNNKIAFRMPNNQELLNFIKMSGPIVAPSANPEGLNPARNIAEAKEYFSNKVDYYIDSGECLNTTPSKLIDIETAAVLR